MTYCNQKYFPCADQIRLRSKLLKWSALNFWMEKNSGYAVYTELDAVFKALESQFDTAAHRKQFEALENSLAKEEMTKKHDFIHVAAL